MRVTWKFCGYETFQNVKPALLHRIVKTSNLKYLTSNLKPPLISNKALNPHFLICPEIMV